MVNNVEDIVLNTLLTNSDIAIATCYLSDLLINYENDLFQTWFETPENEPNTLISRISSIKEDRFRKRLEKKGLYVTEHEVKIDKRSKVFKLHFSLLPQDLVMVRATEYTKEKELEYLLDSYVKMAESNKKKLEASLKKIREQKEELERAYASLERERNTIELRALQAVINPHFVSNCLASIQRFVVDNNTELSVNYLSYFGKLMRMNFEQSYNDYVPLGDIIRILETYVEIEKIRIEHDWTFRLTVDPRLDTENIKIPPLLVQPFLENAIWHGISKKEADGVIDVTFEFIDDITLKCIIMDNGPGRNQAQSSEKSKKHTLHSLNVTGKRLDILWSEHQKQEQIVYQDLFDDDNQPAGTRVELFIPITF